MHGSCNSKLSRRKSSRFFARIYFERGSADILTRNVCLSFVSHVHAVLFASRWDHKRDLPIWRMFARSSIAFYAINRDTYRILLSCVSGPSFSSHCPPSTRVFPLFAPPFFFFSESHSPDTWPWKKIFRNF